MAFSKLQNTRHKILSHQCSHSSSSKKYSRLSLSRLRLSRITAYLEEKIWSLFKHRNLTSGNKILWIRGEIAPEEQFLPFPTIFSIYISDLRSLITYSCVNFGRTTCIFLNSENLICRSSDISICFKGSFQLRDNESRLYLMKLSASFAGFRFQIKPFPCFYSVTHSQSFFFIFLP